MSGRNPIHFRNAHWTGRNCCLPPSALFSLYAPTSHLIAYLHLTFFFGARRARFHEAVFWHKRLSDSMHSITHYIWILISCYHWQACVGAVEFELINVESNLAGFLHWCSRRWSTARRKLVYLGREQRHCSKRRHKARQRLKIMMGKVAGGERGRGQGWVGFVRHSQSSIDWLERAVLQGPAMFLLENSAWRMFLAPKSSSVILF